MKTFGELRKGDRVYRLIHDSVSDPILGIWHKPVVEELTIESVVWPAVIHGPSYSYMIMGQDGRPTGIGHTDETSTDETKVDITYEGIGWPRTLTVPVGESEWNGNLSIDPGPLREIARREKAEFLEKLQELTGQVVSSLMTDE